jgi:hypothetical protein
MPRTESMVHIKKLKYFNGLNILGYLPFLTFANNMLKQLLKSTSPLLK